MALRENDYIAILSPFVTKLGLSGNKLIIFSLIHGFCRDGEQEFKGSINYISEWTNTSRNTVISILKELVDLGLLEKRDYVVNGVKFCAYKVGSQVFAPPVQNCDEGSEIIAPNIIYNNTKEKNEIDKSISKSSDELFETCWVAYRRKGKKGKAKPYWDKLTKSEKDSVLQHIKIYTKTRELQYQQDFERYLRDKTFLSVVVSKNNIVYDPTKLGKGESVSQVYMPSGNFSITWDDQLKAYLYIGFYSDGQAIADGYTDSTRPDGARIVLNNGRGELVWSSITRTWIKQ